MDKILNINEIKYENGERIIPFSPKNGNIGSKTAIKISLDEKKLLKSIKFFVTKYGNSSTTFNTYLYNYDKKNKLPGNKILKEPIPSNATEGDEWVNINLESRNIILEKGDYFIAMEWLKEPGNDGKSAQTIGFAESEKSEERSWMSWTNDDKLWKQDTGPYKGNFMIRAEVKNVYN